MADAAHRGSNLSQTNDAAGQTQTLIEGESQGKGIDTTTDKATAAFIRRVLCSQNVLLGNGERGRNTPRPIEEVLPPLTSSNEVDLQLYGIIAVIIKEFVQTWYSKITPDHVFIDEITQIIAHFTRALEQRLRKVDLEALILDEIPQLLEDHLNGRSPYFLGDAGVCVNPEQRSDYHMNILLHLTHWLRIPVLYTTLSAHTLHCIPYHLRQRHLASRSSGRANRSGASF